MDTNRLKKFARESRKKLLSQVEAKLNNVLTSDSAELRAKGKQLDEIRSQIKKIGKEQFIKQAMGKEQSVANPDKINLFKKLC